MKQRFVEALRATPDGIQGLLTATIPKPPTLDWPTTTDDAIIAQGVLAVYMLDVFRAFAGLTPVELLLRIGQHNSIPEAMLLAGLEYLADTQAQTDFTVKEPVAGQTYQPGDVRIVVTAKNSDIAAIQATVSDDYQTEFTPELASDDDGATFYGYARCAQVSTYRFQFTVTFADDAQTVQSETVTISTSTEADSANPEGEDLTAFDTALAVLDDYYQQAIGQASGDVSATADQILVDHIKSAAAQVYTVASGIQGVSAEVFSAFSEAVRKLL